MKGMNQSKGTIDETEDEFASSELISDSREYGDEYEDSEDDLSREESSVSNIIMSFNKNPKREVMADAFQQNDSTGSD